MGFVSGKKIEQAINANLKKEKERQEQLKANLSTVEKKKVGTFAPGL